MKSERRFKLLTQDGYDTITKGKIYSESFSPGVCNFLKFLEKYPQDWEEIFSDDVLDFKQLSSNILDWAKEKDLIKPENQLKQYAKTVSEVGELGDALIKENKAEVIDAIGDIQVCLIVLCAQLGFDSLDCLESAYNVIKNRTGKTINGTFIKD
jgi:NTP pyrophosphatase (non-canonical NTP hydrolase)